MEERVRDLVEEIAGEVEEKEGMQHIHLSEQALCLFTA